MSRLNGWWRLWMVISLAIVTLALINFSVPETEFPVVTTVTFSGHPSDRYKIAKIVDADARDSKWREGCLTTPVSLDSKSMAESEKLNGLEPGRFEIESRASCVMFREAALNLLQIFVGPAFLLVAGLSFAWVRNGFRQSGSS